MNSCFSRLVGMRNVCDESSVLYYLDDIGISLNMASKIVDTKNVRGIDLVDRKIEQAWQHTLNDVILGGFEFKKVVCEKTYGTTDLDLEELTNGNGVITLNRVGYVDQTSIYIGTIFARSSGTKTITITDGVTTFNYVGTDTTINVRKTFRESTITVTIAYTTVFSGVLSSIESHCHCGGCDIVANGSSNFGLTFDVQQVCDKDRYLCRYAELIAEAVVYKAGALILKEVMDTDRVNDFTIQKEGNLMVNMAYLDSSLNMLQYEQANQGSIAKGMYQKILERLNKTIVAPKKSCCVACGGGSYSISLP